MKPFSAVNAEYERWLRIQCDVVDSALQIKHCRMRESAFLLMRATFFRWAAEIEAILPELSEAPRVLSIGNAHVQNFGIWHDEEGRLVWGVNDFDDAAEIPFPFDLVRLATNATLSKLTTHNSQLSHDARYVTKSSKDIWPESGFLGQQFLTKSIVGFAAKSVRQDPMCCNFGRKSMRFLPHTQNRLLKIVSETYYQIIATKFTSRVGLPAEAV